MIWEEPGASWKESRNNLIGKRFEAALGRPDCEPYCSRDWPYWRYELYNPFYMSNPFYKIALEDTGRRFYIIWNKFWPDFCKYSVYVDEQRIIRSWRYESIDYSSCTLGTA